MKKNLAVDLIFKKNSDRIKIARILKAGGIGVFPTDTIYGLVGSALSEKTIERMYAVRKRASAKPFIVLIDSPRKLSRFGIRPTLRMRKVMQKMWPGPVSIIFPCASKKFAYLHRGTKTLAFRIPKSARSRNFLRLSGPLAAPSANPEGRLPARNLKDARKYFGNKVDFYVSGKISAKAKPSRIYLFKSNKLEIVRN